MSEQKLFGATVEQGRWGFILLGLLMNLCLGAVYAFSVFRGPLESPVEAGGWGLTATQSGLPFMVFLAMFALFMALAGGLVGQWGPKKTGLLGGSLVGAGWILAGFAPNITWLTLFYGVIGGAGVGIIYGCPIAVAAKWFPEKKGLAVGLTVMGFGLSALIMAPLMRMMIDMPSVGLMRTFTVLGVVFAVVLLLLSLPMRFPADGWKPLGWSGQAVRGTSGADLSRRQMVRTSSFYALWGTYTIGCLAGLMAIGISAPVGQQVAQLTPLMAAISVSVFAIFNGVGRPIFGWLTDRITPRNAAALSFVLILAASALLYLWGSGRPLVYLVSFSILWMNLGGWLAIAPTATATLFGTLHYGTNYGLIFTSYGIGALLGNTLAGMIHDVLGGYLPVFLPVMALAAAGLVISLLWLKPVKA